MLIVGQQGLPLSIKLSMRLLFVVLMRWDGSPRWDVVACFLMQIFIYFNNLKIQFHLPLLVLCFVESPHHSCGWWNYTRTTGRVGSFNSLSAPFVFLESLDTVSIRVLIDSMFTAMYTFMHILCTYPHIHLLTHCKLTCLMECSNCHYDRWMLAYELGIYASLGG